MINVSIIGFGNVGSTLALLLLNNKHAIRLNIIEPDKQQEGAFLDLSHSLILCEHKDFYVNDDDLFHRADFIFFTAGKPNVHGGSRLSKAQENIDIVKKVFQGVQFLNAPYAIVITNPVDVIALAVSKYSNLPSEKVLGTGTFLDTMRMEYYLSQAIKCKASDFSGLILGEHGASQVPIFSMTKCKGQALLTHNNLTKTDLDKITEQTKNAAYEIRKTQDATRYGVAKCAEILFTYIIGNEEHIVPLSMQTNAYYRHLLQLKNDIYISMPAVIKEGQISLVSEINLTAEELEAYRKSAAVLAAIEV
jgi:L-lactate dehydrogenase